MPTKCPNCGELLVHPNGDEFTCIGCGWSSEWDKIVGRDDDSYDDYVTDMDGNER